MRTPAQNASFVLLLIVVSLAGLWLALPFFGAILWATILSILFRPLHRLILRALGRPGLAAALSLLVCVVVAVIPAILILGSLAQEASDLFQRLRTRQFDPGLMLDRLRDLLPLAAVQALDALELGDYASARGRITTTALQVSQGLASRLFAIGQGTARFVINLAVMLYLLFFLFRDGVVIAAAIRRVSPLAPAHTDHIMAKFTAVVRATVLGNFVIAFWQGLVGGLTFWAMGFQSALLLGVTMTALSLLPAVGAFMVWLPIAVWLLLGGWVGQGLALVAVGVLLITAVDYLVRPILVGQGARLPDYVILISTMGGIALFGINGFVIGPLIAALFFSVWSLFGIDAIRRRGCPGPRPRAPRWPCPAGPRGSRRPARRGAARRGHPGPSPGPGPR